MSVELFYSNIYMYIYNLEVHNANLNEDCLLKEMLDIKCIIQGDI